MKITVYTHVGDGFYEIVYDRHIKNPLCRAISFTKEKAKEIDVKKVLKKLTKKAEPVEEKSVVYFTRDISPESVLALYHALDRDLEGKVAVKVHSGEPGNQNFIGPELWRPVVEEVNGTVVECNTLYGGPRNKPETHYETLKNHGWSDAFNCEILDDVDTPDMILPIENGKIIDKNYVGGKLANYDSMLVLSHFKGHPMGGFGGALKQISIGTASAFGKGNIHGAGDTDHPWGAEHDDFLCAMADAASSVAKYFGDKIAYISVMKNMSVDCDCCAVAEDPCMADIGILASTDPVALDQACLDLVYEATDDPGQAHLIERIESRNGHLTVEAAEALGIGSRDYVLCEF